jgi:hypothetical protein
MEYESGKGSGRGEGGRGEGGRGGKGGNGGWGMRDYDDEQFTMEARGAVFDYFWYALDSNEASTETMTCNTRNDCDGNGPTQCCVSIIATSPDGDMIDQMYRCMAQGIAEAAYEQTLTTESGNDLYVNLKCMADASYYIKAGIATVFVLFASLY